MVKLLQASFFQRIGKYILLFSTLGIVALILTFVSVSLAVNLGDNIPVFSMVYFNYNVFITYMIGFIVSPLVILYVTKQREKVIPLGNKAMRRRTKFITVGAIAASGLIAVIVVSMILSNPVSGIPGMQQSRLVKSSITTNEIIAIDTDYKTYNVMAIPLTGNGWLFDQLDIDDMTLAEKLGIPSVICENGTRRIIQMDNAMEAMTGKTGATFAFYYLESWWIRQLAIPTGYDPDANATLALIMVFAQ